MQIDLRVVMSDGETVADLKAALAELAGGGTVVNTTVVNEAPKAEKAAPAKAAPAKAAPAKAAPAKAAAPKAEPAPEPEKPAEPEAAAPADDADDEAKMETAVERATGLINAGNADTLRAHLGEIGVKRVSELEGEQLDKFLELTA